MQRLKSKYLFYRDEAPHGLYPVRYFHIILVRVGSAAVVQGELEAMKFPKSTQARSLLQLPIRFYDHDIQLFTSHLESLVDQAPERKNQLRTVFGLMSEASSDYSRTSIFGGDLNLMDKELKQVGLPEDFADVWEACGLDYKQKYTWDTSEPRFRLDRIFVTPKESRLQPVKFELIGGAYSQQLETYISDHLGLWTEFVLNNKPSVDENSGDNETNTREELEEVNNSIDDGNADKEENDDNEDAIEASNN